MTQLYAQASQQGIWMALGPPQSAAFALGQSLVVTYGDGTQDTVSAHVPAVTSAGTTQVDRTGAVWLLYVVHGDPTLRIVREMDQGTIGGSYAPLARVLADRVVPYQPDSGQAQSSTSGQSYLPLSVTNTSGTQSIGGSTTVPVATSSSDYVVQCHLSGSTAASVWNALSDKTGFSDLQVLFAGAEIDADIDQITNGAWSSTNQTLWFRLQRSIAASGTDGGYQLRMGGGLRPVPKRSWANIYPFSDDFLGSALSASWTTSYPAGTSVAGSTLVLAATGGTSDNAATVPTFGAGTIAHFYAQSNASSAAYDPRFYSNGAAAGAYALLQLDLAGSHPWAVQVSGGTAAGAFYDLAAATDIGWHIYSVARDSSGYGYGWVDAAAANTLADGAHLAPGAGGLIILAGSAGPTRVSVDWVKVRPWRAAEPTVSAGTLQSAGALVWQPMTDSTGSVLVDSSGNPIMALASL